MKAILSVLGVLVVLLLLNLFIFDNNDSSAQQLGSKVYWMSIVEVQVGKLAEYHAFAENELMPCMEKYGYNSIVTWQTIVGNIEEVIAVSEFDNMAAYHRARSSLLTSEDWKKVGNKSTQFIKSTRSCFLSATPYSKLQ